MNSYTGVCFQYLNFAGNKLGLPCPVLYATNPAPLKKPPKGGALLIASAVTLPTSTNSARLLQRTKVRMRPMLRISAV